MELDWSTFFLEIVNFLVLVWLLKRFLYRPVLDFVAHRRAETEEAMASAKKAQQESESLKQQYENRLQDWAKERDAAFAKLRREMDEERVHRLNEIKHAIEEEREKARIADERRQREFREHAEQRGLELGARFAGRLLERTASLAATGALVTLAIEGIGALAPEQRNALRDAGNKSEQGVIATAHAIDAQQREKLQKALTDLFGPTPRWEWREAPELIAGVSIALGAWELAANVRDELKGLASLSHGAPAE